MRVFFRLNGRLSQSEVRDITPFAELDHERILGSFRIVVLLESRTQSAGLDAYDGINPWVE